MEKQTTNPANGASTAQQETNKLQARLEEKAVTFLNQRELGERMLILSKTQSAVGGATLHADDKIIVFAEMSECIDFIYGLYALLGGKEAVDA